MANDADIQVGIEIAKKALQKVETDLVKTGAKAGKEAGKKSGKEFGSSFKQGIGLKQLVGANLIASGVTKSLQVISQSARQAVQDMRDFSRGIAEVNSILPANQKLTKDSEKALISFSSQFATGPQEQAKAFYNIISAGVTDTSKALGVLKQANKAATAGLVDIDTAARGLISSVNSYSQSGLTATEASDILFTTVREGRTTFGELADNIGRVASIGSVAGVKFSDLAGTLAFVTKSGINTDEAVIGLRGLLTSVIGPTKDVSAFAKKLKIDFSALALKTKGLGGFLEDLAIKTKGSVVAMRKLFPNVRAFNIAVKVAGGDLNDFNRILAETSNAGGSTAKALAIIQKSFDFKIKQAVQEFRNFFLVIGQTITQTFGSSVANLLPTIRQLGEAFLIVGKVINIGLIAPIELVFNAGRIVFNTLSVILNTFIGVVLDAAKGWLQLGEAIGVVDKTTLETLENLREVNNEVQKGLIDKGADSIDKLFEGTVFGKGEEFLNNLKVNLDNSKAIIDESGVGDSLKPGGPGGEDPAVNASIQQLKLFGMTMNLVRKNGAKLAVDWKKVTQSMKNASIQGLGKGVGAGFAAVGAALVKGENALKAFGKAFIAAIGQQLVTLGTRFILEGIAVSFSPTMGGPAVGGPLIAAGAAMSVAGGALGAIGGGGAGGAAGAGGGVASSSGFDSDPATDQVEEREEPDTRIAVNISGDVLDSDETGLRIIELINKELDTSGSVITGLA